jgi:CRISPR-associated protein (TIGR02710 family)
MTTLSFVLSGSAAGDGEDTFEWHVRKMRLITEGQDSYGEGTRYDQATVYYLDHLVDESAERARRSCPGLPPKVDLLISLTGFSPRITILAYKIMRPERLVVISSENAWSSFNIIHQHVMAGGCLQPADLSPRPCVATDPLSIYRIVQEELGIHTRRSGSVGVAYIDITGGRKVMSAAAALAAWQLNLGLCYIEGEYDEELKQAVPGSDRLLLLDNPTSLFGEQEMKAAEQAFDAGAFEAARNRFEELAGRLAQPGLARFMGALSALYRAWADLDLTALRTVNERVRDTLGPVQRTLATGIVSAVYAQLEYLDRLANGDRQALLLCFNLLDDHYRNVGRHDFAALFSYRTIEGCLAGHLASRYPGFDCDNPDYRIISDDFGSLRADYSNMAGLATGRSSRRSLPSFVGVFSAAVILHVLGDPLAELSGLNSPESLRGLQELARARNKSVLAHGEESVTRELSRQLNAKAVEVLYAYWRIHHSGEDLSVRRAELAFIRVTGAL